LSNINSKFIGAIVLIRLTEPSEKYLKSYIEAYDEYEDNLASAKVMEKNDMVLQDKVENIIDGQKIITRRYCKAL
jgi:hypothetical protein